MNSSILKTPIGFLSILEENHHLASIRFGKFNATSTPSEITKECKQQIEEYFAGRREKFCIPLYLENQTEFQQKVFRQVKKIPFGEVRTYREVAEAIGSPKSYRAVGNALKNNPFPLLIPCHRVISATGELSGYFGNSESGKERKKFLLEFEQGKQK